MSPAIFSPSPVSVTTPTMMPAVAVVAATPSTPAAPGSQRREQPRAASARVSRRTKLSATARSVAQNTARNADMPDHHEARRSPTSDVK